MGRAVTGCSAVSNGADGSTVSDWNEGGGGIRLACILMDSKGVKPKDT